MSHRDDPLERRLLQGKIVMRTTRKGSVSQPGNKTQVHLGSSCLWTTAGAMSSAFSSNHRGKHKYEERRSLKDNFIAKTRLKNSSDSKTKLFKVCFYEFDEIFNVQSIAFFFLNTGRRELQYLNHLKFLFDKPEGFVARSVYNQKTR